MKNLVNKITTAVSSIALFCIGGVFALIGFATISVLAFFAILAAGAALLASPFVAQAMAADQAEPEADIADAEVTA